MKGYVGNIEEQTLANANFREVLYTGPDSQLVVMSLKPGEEIGLEKHDLDQFLRFERGKGEVTIDGKTEPVGDGFATIVPKGSMHNVRNTGSEDLKLYTIYTAPQHPHGTIHRTKADADAAEAHEGH